ncbi:putative reverse transcriptase, RNA-dependent DNA polymerase [Tanacetum coccineum]
MRKSSRNKTRAMENLNFFYQDIGTSSSAGGHLTQEEEAKEALGIRMSQKFALLEEERPIIETIAYHAKVNKNALADTGSDINTMPYWIYEQLGREDMKKVDRRITMINHTQAEAMGILTNVLCQVEVTTLIAKFLILDILIDRDSPIVVGRGFLRTISGIVNTPERLFLTFDGFCHQTFRAARSDVMRNAKSKSDDEEDYQIKRNKFGAPIYGPKPTPYLNCDDRAERSLWEHTMMRPNHQDLNALDNMKPWKRYCFHKFTMSSCYGKDDVLNRMDYDGEIDDMLRIRLGLYQAVELEEEGFNVYFEGGLHSNEHFNAQDYWLSISREENLSLSRSHTSTIKKPILRVIHKMITYGLCQRTTRYDKVQNNDLWLLSMFDARQKNGVLTEDVVRSLSALIYYRDLDRITLRDLIDSDGKLIPEDPQLGVPKVGIPRPPRASMQDLYDRMGRMEIRQEGIERMEYRQSYYWDMYQGVFEHMVGVYSVPL